MTRPAPLLLLIGMAPALAGCATKDATTAPGSTTFKNNPCLPAVTVQLTAAQSTRIDCGNGGTTVTLAGNGASYLVVPQFATDNAANQLVAYSLASGELSAALRAGSAVAARRSSAALQGASGDRVGRPNLAQIAADRMLRARARQAAGSSGFRASLLRVPGPSLLAAVQPPPPLNSIRAFKVRSDFNSATWATVPARLAYIGTNILLYIDTLAPANGFSAAQLQSQGLYFDQTLYVIDTTAFGSPSDLDLNGRTIVLMSRVVNADTPGATCATQGFVAGFFDEEDFNGSADPNSNQGEIFYSIVPDPSGVSSCAHTVGQVDSIVPGVFLHELQHLISFSQHVVVSGGNPGASWMDEGLSIVAEELGSQYYEQKCPPPACRTNAQQIFPDSSQIFIQSMLFDSYQYALLPDTSSVTLHTDSDFGFSWRGGAWLLMRWLGDQMGSGFYRKLEQGPSNGVADIEQAAGQSFPSLFANFGLALYTDSLPGLPRATAPAVNRFTSRNVKQLWARLFTTSGPSVDFPVSEPVQIFSITSDTSSGGLTPGTMTFFRLDTPASSATISIRFSGPAGAAFPAALKPQLAIFRLPPGQ